MVLVRVSGNIKLFPIVDSVDPFLALVVRGGVDAGPRWVILPSGLLVV